MDTEATVSSKICTVASIIGPITSARPCGPDNQVRSLRRQM
jgi:hypothetical protein